MRREEFEWKKANESKEIFVQHTDDLSRRSNWCKRQLDHHAILLQTLYQHNVRWLASLELAQQFKERNHPEAVCSQGTIFSLYNGVFVHGNFTVFGFYESEPNSNEDLLKHCCICQLINLQGEKKSDTQIKVSLKQEVRVPSDFNGMGQQLLYFTTAAEIFFGKESVGVSKLRQLTRLIANNRKHFCDNIALDEWFVPKFLF